MRTVGVKSSHMLKNVIGNKMSKKIHTMGNKIMPHMGSIISHGMSLINPNKVPLKNLSIGNKKYNSYEKRRK